MKEGNLEAPTRHPVDWKSDAFNDEGLLFKELERVFDVCHGCRRCFSLCNSFPTLFEAVDESETGELDSVAKDVYWDVVDHCYLCDMCYMSKCPYVPPHEFNIDFPHLMLRAKHQKFNKKGASTRDKVLSATEKVGSFAGIPVVSSIINAANKNKTSRKVMEKIAGIDKDAPLPIFHTKTARKLHAKNALNDSEVVEAVTAGRNQGKVVIFTTCYGNRNQPEMVDDLIKVYEHNGISTRLLKDEKCCGMPKFELGDLKSVEAFMQFNAPRLEEVINEGWDIVAPIPSCVLMFKQELPLLFPEDVALSRIAASIFDPFEYLMQRHDAGLLKTNFVQQLGKISYQVPCHLRVQNMGLKSRDILNLIPDTKVHAIERCSGHNGTYAVKKEFGAIARKIGRPVVKQAETHEADFFASDCPMASEHIAAMSDKITANHPMSLLRKAYGV
jgi:Fe-S oxidoreductase